MPVVGVLVARAGPWCAGGTAARPGGPGRRPRRARVRVSAQRRRGPPASRPTASTKPGSVLAVRADVLHLHAGHDRPSTAAARAPSGGRRRCGTTPPCSGRGRMSRPSRSRSTSPPRRVDLLGQRGEPVGLVPAQVGDAAQARRRSASAQTAARTGVELADVAQVGVEALEPVAGAADGQARRGRARRARPSASRRSRSASPGWVVRAGQPGIGHPAAGDQGRGEERRGVGQVGLDRAGPSARTAGLDRHVAAAGSPASTSTPRRPRSSVDGHRDVRHATAPAGRRGARRRPGRNAAPRAAAR